MASQVGKAFGLRVIGWSPHLDQTRADEAGVELAPSLEFLLKESDVVSLHLVLSDTTKGIIGAHELSLLKPTALLVNTSRGPLIDETALLDALTANSLAGVGLDVFGQEPLPKDAPIRRARNVVLSPHMGEHLGPAPAPRARAAADLSVSAWPAPAPRLRLRGRHHVRGHVATDGGEYPRVLGWKADPRVGG